MSQKLKDPEATTFRVGLMGASLDTGNRGVSALGCSLIRLISQLRPASEISLLIGDRQAKRTAVRVDGGYTDVQTVNFRLSPRAALSQQLWCILLLSLLYRLVPSRRMRRWMTRTNSWVRSVAAAEFVGDIRGGDSFSDIYGARRFCLGCLPILSVIWIRGGIHLLPQTYGPFRSRIARGLARYILLHAESIWSRDRHGVQEVFSITQGQRVASLCPDVAFALESVRPEAPAIEPFLDSRTGGVIIGLNVNGLVYYGGYNRSNMFGLQLDYRAFLRQLLERLLANRSHRVLLVPHTFAPEGRVESDPAASRDLIRELPASIRDRVHLVTAEYDQHEIKGVIRMCDFFIGSRMHACIAALSQGIPTVGVAYSRKFAGVFETVGAAESVIDARTESVEEAIERTLRLFDARDVNRPLLAARAAEARSELSRAFRSIVGAATSYVEELSAAHRLH
jgi:polysaccharide pyruvyl transferase WcaK-like protein